ncbi:MAG: Transcription termination protein NusB [Olavius algarvensis Delta 4 endosymbiont]|nr:MAG: Transcription termination protein NusB [Olavius algarvensis Delta 4 endosymbiont]
MQALFYIDSRQCELAEGLDLFCQSCLPPKKARPFFLKLVSGVGAGRPDIDALIERFSSNWKVSRMSGVDRNILRIAVFELLCCPDIPTRVTLNEAIDIGKRFGAEESGAFINGILDSIHQAAENEELSLEIDIPEISIDWDARPAAGAQTPKKQVPLARFKQVKGKKGVVKRKGPRFSSDEQP